MKVKNVIIVSVAASCLIAVKSSANLVDENFNRADGSLTGTAPTPGPGGVWENHSGSFGDLLISSGQARIQHGTPSEDAHVQFAAQSTGILSATFDVTVNDDTTISGSDNEYFAHFMTEGSFNFRSRVDIVAPNSAGDFTLGLSSSTSTAETIFPTDFSYNTPINVTMAFDLSTGTGSLTVGGTTITGLASGSGQTLNSFSLRQSDSSNNETVLVDNLVVVPEPASLGLLGLVTGGIYFTRRFFIA